MNYSHTTVKFGPVDAGDKITTTLAVTDAETGVLTTYVVRTTVATSFMPGGFRWTEGSMLPTRHASLTITGAWDRLFADEHLTWIRGWPELDSPEVQALLVADALGPGAVPEHEMGGSYSSGMNYVEQEIDS